MSEAVKQNPLGTGNVRRLMIKFAIPSIISMIINAIYNIVDQLFIGQAVGTLGNAATNVAFPLTTVCVALALMCGVGGAACFNLTLGRGDTKKSVYYIGNAVVMMVVFGVLMLAVTEIFMTPLMNACGATENSLPYAIEYTRIIAIGFPFLALTVGGGHVIRADGSPRMSMACGLVGAILNTGLDALFVMGFGWGMTGAASATVIGQIVSTVMVITYLRHFKTAPLQKEHFRLQKLVVKTVCTTGIAQLINQLSMVVIQIALNQMITYYGALSIYGPDIPLAICGIVMKVNAIYISIEIGLGQGSQPIESFNYGAGNYARVRQAYRFTAIMGVVIGGIATVIFQFFPHQILMMFGNESDLYMEFGVKFFRIFLLMTGISGLRPISTVLFTSIGKPKRAVIISLTREIFIFLPLMFILGRIFGIMGLLYTGPIVDVASMVIALSLAFSELRVMRRMEAKKAAV